MSCYLHTELRLRAIKPGTDPEHGSVRPGERVLIGTPLVIEHLRRSEGIMGEKGSTESRTWVLQLKLEPKGSESRSTDPSAIMVFPHAILQFQHVFIHDLEHNHNPLGGQ